MIKHLPRSNKPPDSFFRPNTRLKAYTGPVHCQNLSQNGHRGTTESFSGQTQDQIMSFCSRQHKTNYFVIYLFSFFFSRANTSSGRARDKKKILNSKTDTTKNPQKPKNFSGSIHDQTFPQVDRTNKNLLRGTNSSKMLLGCNTAGWERHEPTTRKTSCASNKLKLSGNRRPNGIKVLRLWLTCLEF